MIDKDKRNKEHLLKDTDDLIRESKDTLMRLEAVKARVEALIRKEAKEKDR